MIHKNLILKPKYLYKVPESDINASTEGERLALRHAEPVAVQAQL